MRRTDQSLKRIFDFFNVYSFDVWMSLLGSFLLCTLFGLFVRYAECQLKLRKRCDFVDVFWRMLRLLLAQPQLIDYNLIAG